MRWGCLARKLRLARAFFRAKSGVAEHEMRGRNILLEAWIYALATRALPIWARRVNRVRAFDDGDGSSMTKRERPTENFSSILVQTFICLTYSILLSLPSPPERRCVGSFCRRHWPARVWGLAGAYRGLFLAFSFSECRTNE